MALSVDGLVSGVRKVLNGEVSGSLRLVAVGLGALIVWTCVILVMGWNAEALSGLEVQQERFRTLLMLGEEYKTVAPKRTVSSAGNVDVATVFAQVSEAMSLGSRVNRIAPEGRNQSVEINRLYAEELAELQRSLSERGVKFVAAEIRALPAGSERLLTVSAIIGPVN